MIQYRNTVVKVPYDNAGWVYGKNRWQEWCAVNCQGNYDVISRSNTILAGFDLESDAMMFMLRWS